MTGRTAFRAAIALTTMSVLGAGGWAARPASAGPARTPVRMQGSRNIRDYVATKLDDFSATMHVAQHDDHAAEKITRDFGMIYKLRGDVSVKYKEENKMRLDARVGVGKITLIVNGTQQKVRSTIGVNSNSNLGTSPGKRKTLLDAGLLSEGYLAYTESQFLRFQPFQGVTCAVFRISYRNKQEDTSHRIVWIDPKTKITLKREEYNQEGKLNAVYYYRDPQEVAPGIWFPTRIEVYNNENQKAGETVYKNIKVNQGLSDSIF